MDAIRLICKYRRHAGPVSEGWDFPYIYEIGSIDLSSFITGINALYICWKPDDGSRLYVMDFGTHRLHQFNAATPWDIRTLAYSGNYLSVSALTPGSVAASTDGSHIYIFDYYDKTIRHYICSTAGELNTAVYQSPTDFSSYGSGLTGFCMSPDGGCLYLLGGNTNSIITRADLSTPWYPATHTNPSVGIDLGTNTGIGEHPYNVDVMVNAGGRFYVIVGCNDPVYTGIHQYDSATPWDIETLAFKSKYVFDGSLPYVRGFSVANPSGSILYCTRRTTGYNETLHACRIG